LEATKLNDGDPEIYAQLVSATAGTGEGLRAMRKYYDETLKRNPLHYGVRSTMLHYSHPSWFGDWNTVDRQVDEAETASKDFPMLMELYRQSLGMMFE